MNFLEIAKTEFFMGLCQINQKFPFLLGTDGSYTKGKLGSIGTALGNIAIFGCGLWIMIKKIIHMSKHLNDNEYGKAVGQFGVACIGGLMAVMSFVNLMGIFKNVGSDVNVN